ncbi:MAG: murein L,D-transpeptidase family protein [Alphaproteobacteria bacterium]
MVLTCLGLYAHWPSEPLPPGTQADRILVLKGERKMQLLNQGQVIREYTVALGRDPVGTKRREGDNKTPEGVYFLEERTGPEESRYHSSVQTTYPNEEDKAISKSMGVPPGGMISIHSLRNDMFFFGRFHRLVDWTRGCIAINTWEIDELLRVTKDGTPIEIRP